MIDSFDQIKPWITFDTHDDFYYLQIMQRRKEHPELTKNSRVIKNYYIRNLDYLEKRYSTIKDMCNYFKARAGLRLNKRSFKKVAFRTLQNITAQMMQDDFMSARQAFDKACGQCHNAKNKKWIIDIDEKDENFTKEVIAYINTLQPQGDKLYGRLETLNGVHLITSPFNTQAFSEVYKLDIHKDNPVNLYIPDSD